MSRSSGYARWHFALGNAHKALVDADIQWVNNDDTLKRPVDWWAMRARVRHADHSITTELLVSRATVCSIVAYRSRPRWTDSEVVLVNGSSSLSGGYSHRLAEPQFLHLPTVTMNWWGGGEGGTSEQPESILKSELGISIEPDRLRRFGGRHDSSQMAAERFLAAVELTDEEFAQIQRAPTGDEASKGPAVICRIADLLSEPLCDWATIGVITRVIMPTSPPTSGDYHHRHG